MSLPDFPGTNFLCQIVSGTGFVLSLNPKNAAPGSQLILSTPNLAELAQLWNYVFQPDIQACILYNPAYGMYAAPQTLGQGAAVVLYACDDPTINLTAANTWQIQPAGTLAIRSPAVTSLNLNALGTTWQQGTKIGLWTWGGGQPNETWTSKLVYIPYLDSSNGPPLRRA